MVWKLIDNSMLLNDALVNQFAEINGEVNLGSRMLSAQHVADAFVTQYYHILRVSPESVHKFYKESSTLGRPGSDGMMSISTTMKVSSSVLL